MQRLSEAPRWGKITELNLFDTSTLSPVELLTWTLKIISPVSQQWVLMKRNEEDLRTREPCPNVAATRSARSAAAALNPDVSWCSWSDTLVLKPDTLLQTNLCERLSQRISPSCCPQSTFTNNTGNVTAFFWLRGLGRLDPAWHVLRQQPAALSRSVKFRKRKLLVIILKGNPSKTLCGIYLPKSQILHLDLTTGVSRMYPNVSLHWWTCDENKYKYS